MVGCTARVFEQVPSPHDFVLFSPHHVRPRSHAQDDDAAAEKAKREREEEEKKQKGGYIVCCCTIS